SKSTPRDAFRASTKNAQRPRLWAPRSRHPCLLVANCCFDDSSQFRWNRGQTMRVPGVLRARPQNFLHGLAAGLEVAVHSDIPATNDLSHVIGSPLLRRWDFFLANQPQNQTNATPGCSRMQ